MRTRLEKKPVEKPLPRLVLTRTGDASMPGSAMDPEVPAEMALGETKNRLSEVVRAVEGGRRVTITNHGRPVVDLVPHDPAAVLVQRVRQRPAMVTPKPGPSAEDVVRALRGDR